MVQITDITNEYSHIIFRRMNPLKLILPHPNPFKHFTPSPSPFPLSIPLSSSHFPLSLPSSSFPLSSSIPPRLIPPFFSLFLSSPSLPSHYPFSLPPRLYPFIPLSVSPPSSALSPLALPYLFFSSDLFMLGIIKKTRANAHSVITKYY